MKHFLYITIAAAGLLGSCAAQKEEAQLPPEAFVRVDGHNLITPDGEKFFIRGTNLGNWLNPEGYMFGFSRTNSPRFINEMLCQLVGEEAAADFWQDFKDNYITAADIDFIASTGANTIRLPFHYKLFTDEDYMGRSSNHDGYERIDSVVEWCRRNNLYLILDMHDAPGGQTGDNIDDSYGYPWLMESPRAQQLFCDIWEQIAKRYSNEPVILGYELINEPIAHFFDSESLNPHLEPLHKRAVEAIRRHDSNHIVLLGGPQWNSNFSNFSDWAYDNKIMYTCHRYGGDPTAEAIDHYIAFRDSTGLPMYMGEIGHNTDEWQQSFSQVLEDNNIGYTYWPYKKLDGSCMSAISRPAEWDSIVAFSEARRDGYAAIRSARPDTAVARRALREFVANSRFENCTPQKSYIRSMKLNID
ncbi:MAG: glycoside hydrolase family 5 protein [Muribaculaceae bacterium]|nr:glycoside hydrolase family 5 protein [Muribaculaceae bacterium]